MRKMKNKYGTLNIREHVIIKNFWEYYITDMYPEDSDIQNAFVMGDFNEQGDISLEEIKPYIMSRTKKLDELMPAEGFQWED